MQQAATAVLAQANTSQQTVLKLLQGWGWALRNYILWKSGWIDF
jgi:hypothetical protein